MLVVAGPSGSGKSSVFSLYRFSTIDSFNVDDRSAQLNGGSYQLIPRRCAADVPSTRAATARHKRRVALNGVGAECWRCSSASSRR